MWQSPKTWTSPLLHCILGRPTKFRAQSNPRRERGVTTIPGVLYYSGVGLGALCYIPEPFALPKVCHPMACKPSLAAPVEFSHFGVWAINPGWTVTFDRWWRQAGAKQSLWVIDGNWTCSVRHKLQRTTGDQKHWFTFQQVHMDIAEGRNNFKMLCYEMSPRQEGHGVGLSSILIVGCAESTRH